MDMRRLRLRFRALWRRLGGCRMTDPFHDLRRRYDQSHRHYHTLAHVEDCLSELDAIRAAYPRLLSASRWAAVELALWFHDVVYDAGAANNEDRSAAAFAAAARGSLSPCLIAKVRRLILATKHHGVSTDAAHRVLLDCDLAALGRNRQAFQRASHAIRREHAAVTEDRFVAMRRDALRAWDQRAILFQTDLLRRRYERQARTNLASALQRPQHGR
jgi:predicted metal-dependent HD superfamily phosphohydrolase